jgi:hypothetical protein
LHKLELPLNFDLVPISLFVMIGVVLCTFFYFRHRTRLEMQHTVRVAIERGQELSPEVLESLAGDPGGQRDLRRGLIWVAVALGFAGFAWAVDEPDMYGIGVFPLFVGLAYLVLWWVSGRRA